MGDGNFEKAVTVKAANPVSLVSWIALPGGTDPSSVPAYNGDEMNRQVEAVYENGVLRPLEPLPLKEHQKVSVTVSDTEDPLASMIDYEFVESARREIQHADHIPNLEEVRSILSGIPGSLAADIGDEREDSF